MRQILTVNEMSCFSFTKQNSLSASSKKTRKVYSFSKPYTFVAGFGIKMHQVIHIILFEQEAIFKFTSKQQMFS